jgi:hypothetical protein
VSASRYRRVGEYVPARRRVGNLRVDAYPYGYSIYSELFKVTLLVIRLVY